MAAGGVLGVNEFDIIERLLAPLAGEGPPAFGLTDDAAVLSPPPGEALVLTKDVMVAGVHFPLDEDADAVARKLLRVNLSDLAAMGAAPVGYLVGFAATTGTDLPWIEAFVSGLAEDQKAFGLTMLGGDTVSGSQTLVISLTAVGSVPEGGQLLRAGARPGDVLYVSGTIGDAALGLKCRKGELPADEFLMTRFRLPEPRLTLGKTLRGVASAAIDISDGLLADAGHIAKVSGCALRIERDRVPLSSAARTLLEEDPGLWTEIVAGGDDYELLISVPAERADEAEALAAGVDVPIARIGEAQAGEGVVLLDSEGVPIDIGQGGFVHYLGE